MVQPGKANHGIRMNKLYVLSFVGTDRPGLTRQISNTIASSQGNWMESRLSRLAGKYAGILLISLPQTAAGDLLHSLQTMPDCDLKWMMEATESTASTSTGSANRNWSLELIGHDRPGIVRDVTDALRALSVNIEDMRSEITDAPMSSEVLFKAKLQLSAPESLPATRIEACIEALTDELMFEVNQL